MNKNNFLTPKEIVQELDKYIIGQGDAKRNVAIALRNRWRRMNTPEDIQGEIVPNNILMIGATGVGKTEIARRLARIADAPFTKVEASKFTEVGYVGRDVESMVRDLVEQSVNLVKAAKKEEVKEKAAAVVEDIILDALIPPMKSTNNKPVSTTADDGVPQNDYELNQKTRERFREKLQNGELEDRKIDINVKAPSGNGMGVVGGGMMDER
jgi:ATP-dependent HslUV protease ATP-binding subunit HslU